MPVDFEKLREELDLFGVDIPEDDPVVNEKIETLCSYFGLDEGEFSSEWVAFSSSKSEENKVLSYENLLSLHQNLVRERQRDEKSKRSIDQTGMEVDDDDFGLDLPQRTQKRVNPAEMLELYGTPEVAQLASNVVNRPLADNSLTPKSVFRDENSTLRSTPGLKHLSPDSFSPVQSKLPEKYKQRENSMEVVCSFGNCDSENWRGTEERKTDLEVKEVDPKKSLKQVYKYMLQKVPDVVDALDDQVEEFGERISEQFKIEEFANVRQPNQGNVYICGQVVSSDGGRLSQGSVMIQGSTSTSLSSSVALDTAMMPMFTFFPGQVTVLEGTNPSGRKFAASKQICGVVPPQFKAKVKRKLTVMVAAGPFSTTDGFTYHPLYDFLVQVCEYRPDLVLLMGPFVDIKHPQVENGTMERTFVDVFERIVVRVSEMTQDCGARVILIPCSNRDAHQESIYPSAPFVLKKAAKRIHKNIHFLSDPCMVEVGGVAFGLTATDILFKLGAEEISGNRTAEKSDRMHRLVKHLMQQHSFYPLYPSAEDVNVDYEHLRRYCTMELLPNLLITPSDLRYFVKEVEDVCCVNPGRLARGVGGGTFARISINVQDTEASICDQTAVQILKI